MTIELALSGLSYSMFCALITLILIGLGLISATVIILGLIRALAFLMKAMKGGVDNLKESAKALSQSVTENN